VADVDPGKGTLCALGFVITFQDASTYQARVAATIACSVFGGSVAGFKVRAQCVSPPEKLLQEGDTAANSRSGRAQWVSPPEKLLQAIERYRAGLSPAFRSQ